MQTPEKGYPKGRATPLLVVGNLTAWGSVLGSEGGALDGGR